MDMKKMSDAELQNNIEALQKQYDDFKSKKLHYDMSRGKPCKEQLELSNEMLDCFGSHSSFKSFDGTECRNYGGLDGFEESKEFFSKIIGVEPSETIVGGNSSLNMMYDTIARAMTHGVLGSEQPWGKLPRVKFICPSPGYDRHFAICQFFGIEMIVVDMQPDGPDMDTVEQLVSGDNSIKGIWCVPKYSNPEGITYSDAVVERLARLKPAAKDFRIFYDNAYTVHHLTDAPAPLQNILAACKAAGNPDMVFVFSSTSKITFPGGGVAVMGASEANTALIKKQLSIQTIGPDKINQLMHVRYFENSIEKVEAHMKKHARIIKPKFDMVLSILESELGDKNIGSWTKPNGGYFISFNTLDGCAEKVVALAAEAGVTMTNAGATFPYGKDPRDRNIRIAPTFPSLNELENAIRIFCICVQLASAKKILDERKTA